MRKDAETWHSWNPNLGPTRDLHAAFYGKHGPPISWPEYRKRYLAEVLAHGEEIEAIAARVAAGETITLLCSSACIAPARCHRSLLAGVIVARTAR